VKKINDIVIVGGGSAGWMTAATMISAFPEKNISVIESKDVPIIGVGESTLGSIRNWTRFIGLEEDSFFKTTDASYKLSIKFTDFYKKDSGSFHYPFGNPFISTKNSNPLFDWHVKKYFFPDTPIQDFTRCIFPASSLFENNKFSLNRYGEFANFNSMNDVAYHFDATKFGNWLREFVCIPRGVNHIIGTVKDIKNNEMGIEKLIIDDGIEIQSDLYIDCTGWKSLLLGDSLKEPFISFSDMLPNNSAWATRVPYKNRSLELEGYTNCTARENGWCWNIPLWSRLGTGYVYSDKFVSKENALEEFKKYLMSDRMVIPRSEKEVDGLEFKNISMRVGIHERTFVKNVVAIGLSAGFIEPLESNGLFSVHEFLLKLVDILQRGEISQFDRDMYNVSVKDTFTSFAKFVALHYALSHRDDTEYWRDCINKSFTDKYGDPYFPYKGRSDVFYDLIWRYMEEWGHPYGLAGIPFIATGQNLLMMNRARIDSIQYRFQVDLFKDIKEKMVIWESNKKSWLYHAEKCPTLEQFLDARFYHENMPDKSALDEINGAKKIDDRIAKKSDKSYIVFDKK
jgi:flavin-dependent dehydrogenase